MLALCVCDVLGAWVLVGGVPDLWGPLRADSLSSFLDSHACEEVVRQKFKIQTTTCRPNQDCSLPKQATQQCMNKTSVSTPPTNFCTCEPFRLRRAAETQKKRIQAVGKRAQSCSNDNNSKTVVRSQKASQLQEGLSKPPSFLRADSLFLTASAAAGTTKHDLSPCVGGRRPFLPPCSLLNQGRCFRPPLGR